MNATDTNVGGWEKSELRAKMNSGEIWNLMPSDFQSKVKPVRKLTNNVGGGKANKNAAVTATTDRLFLLSYSEIVPTSYLASDYPWTSNEGTQYEAFRGKVTENHNVKNPRCLLRHRHWSKLVGAYGVYDVSEGPCCGFPPCQKRRRFDTILLRVVRGLRLLCLELLGILSYKPT